MSGCDTAITRERLQRIMCVGVAVGVRAWVVGCVWWCGEDERFV